MIQQIQDALKRYIDSLEDSRLKDGISYALLNGGKRLRPLLMLQVIDHYNLNANDYVDIAIALEILHTYSLVHDDLPSMDNDSLRRGKPTLHIAFDEATAVLVGDALLTDSFSLLSTHSTLTDTQKISMIQILSTKTGSKGMVLGQDLDLESESKIVTIDILNRMYELKTANLLQASLMLGAVVSNQIQDLKLWEKLGYYLGVYFQIQDDLLEAISTPEAIGKSKSDEDRSKPTYISLVGIENTKKYIASYEKEIDTYCHLLNIRSSALLDTIEKIKKREN